MLCLTGNLIGFVDVPGVDTGYYYWLFLFFERMF